MGKRLLEYDPETQTRVWHEYDSLTKQTVIRTEQNCESILECNRQMRNDPDVRAKGIKRSWMKLATIPNTVLHKWMLEDDIKPFTKEGVSRIAKKVHERDWSYLKTVDGTFIRK